MPDILFSRLNKLLSHAGAGACQRARWLGRKRMRCNKLIENIGLQKAVGVRMGWKAYENCKSAC